MPVGKVKWFSNAKGYGFIVSDVETEDLFAHYSAIRMDGYRSLQSGQWVDFEIGRGEKGLQAVDITPLPADRVAELEAAAVADAVAPAEPADAVTENQPVG